MPRLAVALLLAVSATAAPVAASAQEEESGALDRIGRIDAAEYIRGILANDDYDPRDRERARNYQPEFEAGTHWRSSIFDGQRTRATRGTGLQIPVPREGSD
jgi:hypothetical protein